MVDAELPSGTVTFLFTDIEGSTRRWEEHPTLMEAALARHDAILEGAIAAHAGAVIARMGDGVAAAFGSARQAISAGVAAQQHLAGEAWPDSAVELRVRMGVHTGEGILVDGHYLNQPLNRCARLMAVAHGGQLLVSGTTEPLVRGSLPAGSSLVDLGEHRLRDLSEPLRVFQVQADRLAPQFAPLRSVNAYSSNLPIQVTSFVGREDELAWLVAALDSSRLLTLTGVGGVGKTRLALHAGADLLPRFPSGVWLCELAPCRDGPTMLQAVADAVGAYQREGMSLADSIVEYLGDRTSLLLLDNCEHVLAAAASFASAVLQRCPNMQILATSREALAVPGEQIVGVPSLPVPDAADDRWRSDAVRLFADRALAVRPGFDLGRANLASVSEICRRLDGIPLAIELAAARVSTMTPAEIGSRLDERFRLLTGGRRGQVERHQTLRATVEWSYSLLAPADRLVFNRLGVFVGDFDAAAAEATVTDDQVGPWDVVDSLTALAGKSMVLAEPNDEGVTRFRLLETLRAFALEQLDAKGEADHWRRRHARHYAAWSETAGPGINSPDDQLWLARVAAELDNIRAALQWGGDSPDQHDADIAIRTAAALLAPFGSLFDLSSAAVALLPRARTSTLVERATIMVSAAGVLSALGDPDGAEELAREGLAVPGATDSYLTLIVASVVLVIARLQRGRPTEALALLAEHYKLMRASDLPGEHQAGPHNLAMAIHMATGDLASAAAAADTALANARAFGNPSVLSMTLPGFAATRSADDRELALAAYEESIAMNRSNLSFGNPTMALDGAARLRAARGDRRAAFTHLRAVITLSHERGMRSYLGGTVEQAIATLACLGEDELAVTCLGIAQSQTISALGDPMGRPTDPKAGEELAARLGHDAYQAAFDRGASLSYSQVAPTLLAEIDRLLAAESSTETIEP